MNSEMKMLERLLESRFKPERSVGGTIASVTGHTALVAAALYATAQTHVRVRPTDDVVHVAYVTPAQPVSTSNPAPPTRAAPIKDRRPIFVNVKIPEISPLPIAFGSIVARPGDFTRFPMDAADGAGASLLSSGATFRADQVEKQVAVLPGGSPPRYPEALRLAGVEGRVVAVFVVHDPAEVGGRKVRQLVQMPFVFKLSR